MSECATGDDPRTDHDDDRADVNTELGKFNTDGQFRMEVIHTLAAHLDKTLMNTRLTKEAILKPADGLDSR